MMALIDRGRVMTDYLENLGRQGSYKAKYEALCKAVDDAPAVDAAPVVHGRWIEQRVFRPFYGKCSECGAINEKDKFCPNCGAKMDGDGHE